MKTLRGTFLGALVAVAITSAMGVARADICPHDTTGIYNGNTGEAEGDGYVYRDDHPSGVWWMSDALACYNVMYDEAAGKFGAQSQYRHIFPQCDLDRDGVFEWSEVLEIYNNQGPCSLPTQSCKSIEQYGITWTFDREYPCGQFANGDWWVVGTSVVITDINPVPQGVGNARRHGFEINPAEFGRNYLQPYDGRVAGGAAPGALPAFPLAVAPDSSVVSSESHTTPSNCQTNGNTWLSFTGECSRSWLKSVAILTVLGTVPPEGSFRPPYSGSEKIIYSTANLRPELLPSLPSAGMEVPQLSTYERYFERPWVDHLWAWPSREIHATENFPNAYGADLANDLAEGAYMLMLDFSQDEKEQLLNEYVQLGIDFYHMALEGRWWPGGGGHGLGRKLPILLAGLMLNDPGMLGIGTLPPPPGEGTTEIFHEDCATGYNRPEYVYFGRTEISPAYGINGFPLYGGAQCWRPGRDDETNPYRTCCTSNSFAAHALAARLLGLEQAWNHPAFFDYTERWMDENILGIRRSPFFVAMWNHFRHNGAYINTCENGIEDRCSLYCNSSLAPTSFGEPGFEGEEGVDCGSAACGMSCMP